METVAASSKRNPNRQPREKKLPHRPQTSVALRSLEDGSAEVVIGFRRPVRRILREGFDERIAMTPIEAENLYARLGRVIAADRRRWRAARQGSGCVE